MRMLALLTNAKKKMDKMLDDFNRALPVMKSLGLSVTGFNVKMGLLPAVLATLQGSFKDIDSVKVRHLKEGNSDNKILMSLLRALESASNIKGMVHGLPVEGIQLRLKLSVFPDIDVGFIIPESPGDISEMQIAQAN